MNCRWCNDKLDDKTLSWFGKHHKFCSTCEDEYRVAMNNVLDAQERELKLAKERALKAKE